MKAEVGAAQITGQKRSLVTCTSQLQPVADKQLGPTDSSAHGHLPRGPVALLGLHPAPQRYSTMHLSIYRAPGNIKRLHTPHERDLTP